ncbi:MAG: hypothetical protein CMB80_08610 [Flammeovirgaceae bacterium]|nr:hypothetical protein [Flammeovirgaceae bacterium]MBE62348.1 hypothetical protein [Flammeovirgaceae bacterium]HCX21213.1 hypothetical protein [Cytophagales bacterium]|tara:strand:+ start:11639 stop:11986 length:348 start_codon:yes stop_codon:yes gene_type:complete
MKLHAVLYLFLAVVLLEACNQNRPIPPDNWVQKVNNQSINKITFTGDGRNCASSTGPHVLCGANYDSIPTKCYAMVMYLDGTPKEEWQKECTFLGDTLIFDDGQFSYFYGSKSNP